MEREIKMVGVIHPPSTCLAKAIDRDIIDPIRGKLELQTDGSVIVSDGISLMTISLVSEEARMYAHLKEYVRDRLNDSFEGRIKVILQYLEVLPTGAIGTVGLIPR